MVAFNIQRSASKRSQMMGSVSKQKAMAGSAIATVTVEFVHARCSHCFLRYRVKKYDHIRMRYPMQKTTRTTMSHSCLTRHHLKPTKQRELVDTMTFLITNEGNNYSKNAGELAKQTHHMPENAMFARGSNDLFCHMWIPKQSPNLSGMNTKAMLQF